MSLEIEKFLLENKKTLAQSLLIWALSDEPQAANRVIKSKIHGEINI